MTNKKEGKDQMTDKKEDPFTQIPNRCLEALCRINLPPVAYRVALFLFRQTFGFHREWYSVGVDDFAHFAGLDRRAIQRGIGRLKREGVIEVKRRAGKPNEYAISENYGKRGAGCMNSGDSDQTPRTAESAYDISDCVPF